MSDNFSTCLDITLVYEGGFSNHPSDPGGATNMGITKATYEKWLNRPVTIEEIKNLSKETVSEIYRRWYWDKCWCGMMPSGVDLIVFDFAVNSGVFRAVAHLQSIIPQLVVDGEVGPLTLAGLHKYCAINSKTAFIDTYQNSRINFLKRLPTFATFGKGWLNRINHITTEAKKMV